MSPIAHSPSWNECGPIKQLDLVQETVCHLRRGIVSGQFGPNGELPTESQLAIGFGVSRTVIREAMRVLRSQGLVSVSRGRKSRVRLMEPKVVIDNIQTLLSQSVSPLHDAFEIRHALEREIAQLAAR